MFITGGTHQVGMHCLLYFSVVTKVWLLHAAVVTY